LQRLGKRNICSAPWLRGSGLAEKIENVFIGFMEF
jgi:hypothetical protein